MIKFISLFKVDQSWDIYLQRVKMFYTLPVKKIMKLKL